MRRLIILLLAAAMLSGCSCQRQAERLRARCPECFLELTLRDTIAIPARRIDTIAPIIHTPQGPAIVIERRDMTLQILFDGDSAAVRLDTPPDTVAFERLVDVPCPDCPECPPQVPLEWKIVAAVWTLIIILLLIALIRKK